MKKKLLLLCCLLGMWQLSMAQQDKKLTSDARFVVRPMVFINYNLYHWYQEPYRIHDKRYKNMGQVMSVLPGLGGGIILGKKTTLLFSLEASINYFPFSLDLAAYEGMGALSFPIVANLRIPLNGFLFVQVGGGIQWNQINIHPTISSSPSPFFRTYIGELGIGAEENLFILYFLRFGYQQNQATTFDFGLKIGLHGGGLWD